MRERVKEWWDLLLGLCGFLGLTGTALWPHLGRLWGALNAMTAFQVGCAIVALVFLGRFLTRKIASSHARSGRLTRLVATWALRSGGNTEVSFNENAEQLARQLSEALGCMVTPPVHPGSAGPRAQSGQAL